MTESKHGIHESIDRYLANHLGDAERESVETRIVGDPAFRHEVELTAALRDGLRELDRQGRVAPLLKTRTGIWPRSPIAIAASILALALGVAALLFYQRIEHVRRDLAAAPGKLVVATLRFEQTRGAETGPDMTWQRPSQPTVLEMRFDVGLEPAADYSVVIERLQPGAEPLVVLSKRTVPSADGTVPLTVDSAVLASGDYRIHLAPQPASSMTSDPTAYTLRITD